MHVPSVLGMSTGITTYLISEDFLIHNGSKVVNQELSWFQKTSIAQKLDIKRQSQARLVYIIQCIYRSGKLEPSLVDLFPPDTVFLIVDVKLGRKKHIQDCSTIDHNNRNICINSFHFSWQNDINHPCIQLWKKIHMMSEKEWTKNCP